MQTYCRARPLSLSPRFLPVGNGGPQSQDFFLPAGNSARFPLTTYLAFALALGRDEGPPPRGDGAPGGACFPFPYCMIQAAPWECRHPTMYLKINGLLEMTQILARALRKGPVRSPTAQAGRLAGSFACGGRRIPISPRRVIASSAQRLRGAKKKDAILTVQPGMCMKIKGKETCLALRLTLWARS